MKLLNFFKYLASFVAGIVACSFALLLLVDRLVMPDREVSRSWYHELLLDQVPGPRIIVDSGSNSRYGIVPELIELAFGRPTIVVADYAGVPLRMKIIRLEKYAREGDIIILPLEWQFYFSDDYASDFLKRVFKPDSIDFSGYYFAMRAADRLEFIIKRMNLDYMVTGLTRRLNDPRQSTRRQLDDAIANMNRGIGGNIRIGERTRNVQGKNCEEFISARALPLSPRVSWAARRLAELQSALNVKVVLTWPSVAGNDCYNSNSEVDLLAGRIRTIFEGAGIAVVGDPRQSVFSDDHVLDTYFHIDTAAAQERTARLIEDMKAAGLSIAPTEEKSTGKIALAAVAKEEARINEALPQLMVGS